MTTAQARPETEERIPLEGMRGGKARCTTPLLGAAVVATALGLAVAAFRGDGTALNAFLFMDAGVSHVDTARIERSAVSIVLLLSFAGMIWLRWSLFLPAAGYILAESLARWHVQGEPFSDWVLMSHAARYATPLVLILLLLASKRSSPLEQRIRLSGDWILRIALAAMFAAHGFQAVQAHPVFVDMIIMSSVNLLDVRATESTARIALQAIGYFDIAVAGALLIARIPAVIAWAAFWGGITAFARLSAFGWGAYPDVLVRASHFIGPVALWLLVARQADRTAIRALCTSLPQTK